MMIDRRKSSGELNMRDMLSQMHTLWFEIDVAGMVCNLMSLLANRHTILLTAWGWILCPNTRE